MSVKLSEAELLLRLKERGIHVSAANGRLKISAPGGELNNSERDELLRRKPALLAMLGAEEKPLAAQDSGGPIPLTHGQERLWIAERYAPGSAAYSMPEAFLIEAPVSVPALQQAACALVFRHAVLRTYFREEAGEPLQLLSGQTSFPVGVTDLSALEEGVKDQAARQTIRAEAQRPFDLYQPPLFRIHLIRMTERRHIVFLNIHHIIADQRSLSILRKELVSLYASAMSGRDAQLPHLPVQYRDYAIWERANLREDAMDEQLRYWRKKLEGAGQSPRLPFARPRPAAPSARGATKAVSIPMGAMDALAGLARESGATPFMALMAAFAVLLHRYSGEADFCLGMPITRRTRVETENLIGLFVNLLILRCRLRGAETFRQVLAAVREDALEAYANSDVPFQRVVSALNPERAGASSPLVQIVLALDSSTQESAGPVQSIETGQGTSKFDLTLQLTEDCEGVHGYWEYSADVFDEAGIGMLSAAFLRLLGQVALHPDLPVRELNLGGKLRAGQHAEPHRPKGRIHELLAAEARKRPGSAALVSEGASLTYEALDRKSNQLARLLARRGVGRGSRVGLALDRSIEAIVAMAGVLKAGGAYVLLDPAYPEERLRVLVEDAEVHVALASAAARIKLDGIAAAVLDLDQTWTAMEGESPEPFETEGDGEDLACILYTSGSTGKPNGVLIPHRGVVRLVKDAGYARLDSTEVFLQLAPLSFDASTFEIWAPLLNGGRLALMPPGEFSLDSLGHAIREYGVTTLWLTAGLFHAIVDERIGILKPLRQLLAGGDVLSPKHVYRFLDEAPDCVLINGYGPTENTTFTCCYTVPAGGPRRASIPIGTPIASTAVYLLDSNLSPAPQGAPGEVYIGGAGLALGYSGNSALTEARFIPNPFSHEPGARLFRSGDLARYLPDGNLEFLGRADAQVKINGYRIETGEIESVLRECPGVANAVVIAREDDQGQKYLAAYVAQRRGAEPGSQVLQLRRRLLENLPAFLQPATITLLEELPLTANGKVDRNALPAPRHALAGENTRTAPPDEFEARLREIWEEVLGIRPIGLTDDFFTLGGHSVLALRMFSKIEAQWGRHLPLSTLLTAPTVEQLARELRKDGLEAWNSLVAIRAGGARPPLYIVSGVGGNVVRFRDLAHHLGPDQPVYALQPPGLDRAQPFLTRVEDLAAHHIAQIRAKHRQGPYYLAGYSFGGAVVFEMARQLAAQGEEPAMVVLLDAPEGGYAAREQRGMSWRQRWSSLLRRVRRVAAGPDRRVYLSERFTRLAVRMAYAACDVFRLPIPQRLGDIADVNQHAAVRYRPQPYPGRIILLRTSSGPWAANDDGTLGWSAWAADGVEVYEIPGTHEDLTNEPNVQFLAKILTSCLRACA